MNEKKDIGTLAKEAYTSIINEYCTILVLTFVITFLAFALCFDMKDIQMPWWCTGSAMDNSYVTIVCFLPEGEDLLKYWDDAYDIDSDERTGITYTDRFPKPDWIK